MAWFVIKIIIGLFIWMVLPHLIYEKHICKKKSLHFFINITCKIIGIAIITFAILNFTQTMLS